MVDGHVAVARPREVLRIPASDFDHIELVEDALEFVLVESGRERVVPEHVEPRSRRSSLWCSGADALHAGYASSVRDSAMVHVGRDVLRPQHDIGVRRVLDLWRVLVSVQGRDAAQHAVRDFVDRELGGDVPVRPQILLGGHAVRNLATLYEHHLAVDDLELPRPLQLCCVLVERPEVLDLPLEYVPVGD